MKIGCHVSIAGGVLNAPKRARDFGCEVMQIFTRSPQGGKAPELTKEICQQFKIESKKWNIAETYIHTPYYINFASSNNRIRYGSKNVVRDELERASLLGAKYVMTHLGTAKELGEKEALQKVVKMLKEALEDYGGGAKLLLENSAGAGQIIGDDLAELAKVIRKIKSGAIAGICLDTQHSFASGYDWRNFNATLNKIEKKIGLEMIKLIHANDSQSGCGSKRDRHAHIGEGLMGKEVFKKMVKFSIKKDIDMILETNHDKVKKDIFLLKSLRAGNEQNS